MRPGEATTETVGVLGGTFDPVHLGHLHAAEQVRRAFILRRVLLVPCAVPPHKSRPGITASHHRLAMLRLAAAGRAGLEVSSLEIDRGGVSYTLDTLRALRDGAPPLRPLAILGIDALRELRTWHRYEEILAEFDLVAVERPPEDAGPSGTADLPRAMSRIVHVPAGDGTAAALAREGEAGEGGRIYRLAIPPVAVSSSRVRALAQAGESIAGLVPPQVARYIQDHGLYR